MFLRRYSKGKSFYQIFKKEFARLFQTTITKSLFYYRLIKVDNFKVNFYTGKRKHSSIQQQLNMKWRGPLIVDSFGLQQQKSTTETFKPLL